MLPLFEPLDSGIIEGGRQCGKSNLLLHMMKNAYESGYEIITNIHITIPHLQLDSKNKNGFMNQLKMIMKQRFDNHDHHPTFVGMDELQIIVPSQKWKACSDDADMWAQVAKVGFTVYATAPQRSMIYNGYRDSCNKIITCKKLLRTDTEFKYKAIFQRQSDKEHTSYMTYAKMIIDGSDVFDLYDNHEGMYI